MENSKAKSINMLLYEGNLDGVISVEDTSWNSGELYSAPRESINQLLNTNVCSKYGVYLLLSQNMVYVGQSSDLAKRITQHLTGKSWWTNVVILTTKDDQFNHSDIDFLESVLINKALSANKLDCENKNKGNPPKVNKYREVYLRQYLEEALFLLNLIGISVFNDTKSYAASHIPSDNSVSSLNLSNQLSLGKNAKPEAINVFKSLGIVLSDRINYANRQASRDEYWINPNINRLADDWNIILNNNTAHELLLLFVPKNSLRLNSDTHPGIFVRKDAPNKMDLNIHIDTLIDRKSGINFTPYVVKKIYY